jgi:glutamate-1-semialdehyde aminotransferase
MSKSPSQWVQGVSPNYVSRAPGAHVWDVDGNRYLDFPMALGPVLLGHAYPAVNEAIAAQLADGITFTLPHPLEVEVAERLHELVPGAERVRFAKSGSDVTSAAVRLARAFTGREVVLAAGYHGWHDWYVASTSRNLGVPEALRELVRPVPFGDLDQLEAALGADGGVAAVILEPATAITPSSDYLRAAIELARDSGALCIFDEVITGFRWAPGGAQEHFGVTADLACFGKALGNGMPISALTGRAEVMDLLEEVFVSGTHGGETLSLAAARATLDVVASEPVTAHVWRLGSVLREGLSGLIARHGLEQWVDCMGAPPWTIVAVREPGGRADVLPAKSLLQQELLLRGVLFNGSHFVSFSHTDEDIDKALRAYDEALGVLAHALPDGVEERLLGPPLSPVFRAVQ